jgi:hypothetical protein
MISNKKMDTLRTHKLPERLHVLVSFFLLRWELGFDSLSRRQKTIPLRGSLVVIEKQVAIERPAAIER